MFVYLTGEKRSRNSLKKKKKKKKAPSSDVPFVAPKTHIDPYFLSVSSTTSTGLAVFTPFPVLILFAMSHSDFASHAIARTLHSAYFSIKELRLAMMKCKIFLLFP